MLNYFSKEAKFWRWFRKHDELIFHFEQDQERAFDQLSAALKKLHPSLCFEFSSIQDGKREFVISADGIKDAFPAVKRLVAAAPRFDRWVVIAFRQPRSGFTRVNYSGLSLDAEQCRFSSMPDGDKVGLILYLPGYEEEKSRAFHGAAFLLLDMLLGEYTVETEVGAIQVERLTPDIESADLQPLSEVGRAFFAA